MTMMEGVMIMLLLGLALQADASPSNDLKANAEWVTSHIWNRSGNETVAPPGSLYTVIGSSYPTTKNGSEFVFANFTATGTNAGAGMEVDEPSHGSLETRASVWWMWVSPVNATMRVTTRGSSPCDTSIAVYVPAPWDGIRVTNAFGVHAVSRGLRMDDEEFNVPGAIVPPIPSTLLHPFRTLPSLNPKKEATSFVQPCGYSFSGAREPVASPFIFAWPSHSIFPCFLSRRDSRQALLHSLLHGRSWAVLLHCCRRLSRQQLHFHQPRGLG